MLKVIKEKWMLYFTSFRLLLYFRSISYRSPSCFTLATSALDRQCVFAQCSPCGPLFPPEILSFSCIS